jgi:ATP-dependent Clp protease adaptor protein ClpS
MLQQRFSRPESEPGERNPGRQRSGPFHRAAGLISNSGWTMTVNRSLQRQSQANSHQEFMADKRTPTDPNRPDTNRELGVATKTKPKTKKPSLYRVLLLNDDYTPMEFVVLVLEHFFNKSREEATRIMLHVHNYGVGVCGVYPYDVAETKVAQVLDLARRNEHPLQCTMERED